MIIAMQLKEMEAAARHLREVLLVAKDAIKSAERSVERIEEQLRVIRMTK